MKRLRAKTLGSKKTQQRKSIRVKHSFKKKKKINETNQRCSIEEKRKTYRERRKLTKYLSVKRTEKERKKGPYSQVLKSSIR